MTDINRNRAKYPVNRLGASQIDIEGNRTYDIGASVGAFHLDYRVKARSAAGSFESKTDYDT